MDGGEGGGTGVTDVHHVNNNDNDNNNNNTSDSNVYLHHNATSTATTSNVASAENTRPQNPLKRKSTSSIPTQNQSAVIATNDTANAFIGGRNNRAWRSWMAPDNQQENSTVYNVQPRPPPPQPPLQAQTQTQTRPRPTPVLVPPPSAAAEMSRPSPLQSETLISQPNALNSSMRSIASPSTTQHVQSPIPPQYLPSTQNVAQQQPSRELLLLLRHRYLQQWQQQYLQAHPRGLQPHTRVAQSQQQAQQMSIQQQQLQRLQLQENQVHLRMAREQQNQQIQQAIAKERLSHTQPNSQLQSPVHGGFPTQAHVTPTQLQYGNPTQGSHVNQAVPPPQNPLHVRPQPISSWVRGTTMPAHSHPQSAVGHGPTVPEQRARSMSDTTQRPVLRPDFSYVLTDTGNSVPGHKIAMDYHLLPPALYSSQKVPEGETLFMAIKEPVYFNLSVTPNIFHSCLFQVPDPSKVAVSRPTILQHGQPSRVRLVEQGSLSYRIRFVNVAKILTKPDLSTWGCFETKHPPCSFAEINGQILDFRKKKNWGKDLPTDITDYIQQGANEVKVAVFEDQTERDASKESIAFCIEVLEVTSRTTIHKDCLTKQFIPIHDAKLKIRERIKPRQSKDDEDLVTVGSDTIALDIQCPISKTTLKVPVRGKHCSHIECFDLDSFLSSRPKYVGGVSIVDAWSCPICGSISDCRPQNLVTDGFIQETIRKIIADRGGQHNVDRVIVRSDGLWRVYNPDVDTNETKGKKKHEVIDLLDDD